MLLMSIMGGTISIWLGIGWSSFEMRAILFYVVKG